MFRYRERVLPSALNLALPVLLFLTVFAIMLPLNPALAFPVAILAAIVLVAILFFTSPTIAVSKDELVCGKTSIPLGLLGNVEVIPREMIFTELGRNLDARAWLSIQASVKGLVKITLNDPDDSTPYWLVSTRKPTELIRALEGN